MSSNVFARCSLSSFLPSNCGKARRSSIVILESNKILGSICDFLRSVNFRASSSILIYLYLKSEYCTLRVFMGLLTISTELWASTICASSKLNEITQYLHSDIVDIIYKMTNSLKNDLL